jgi:N-methylhydantoinase A
MKLDALGVEALNWRLICQGPSPDAPFSAWSAPTQGNAASALMHYRSIYIPAQSSFVEAPVYDRYQLARGTCFDGPAIIEERESTVVINCQAKIEVDAYANILVDID